MRRFILATLALGSLAALAQAQTLQSIVADTHHSGAAGYQGPGDVLSGASHFYGLRGYNATVSAANAKALNLVSTSHSSETCDILLASTGVLGLTANCSGAHNGISLATFCNSNSDCGVNTIYDQVGTDDVIATTFLIHLSVSPLLIPCSTGGFYQSAGNITLAQPLTVSTVSNRTSSVSNSGVMALNSPTTAGFSSTSGSFLIYAGNVVPVAGYTEAEQVSSQYTFDGTSSVMYSHGSTTSVNSTGLNPGTGGGSGKIAVCAEAGGGSDFVGSFWEAGVWQGTAANHTNFPFASMTTNQRSLANGWNF